MQVAELHGVLELMRLPWYCSTNLPVSIKYFNEYKLIIRHVPFLSRKKLTLGPYKNRYINKDNMTNIVTTISIVGPILLAFAWLINFLEKKVQMLQKSITDLT